MLRLYFKKLLLTLIFLILYFAVFMTVVGYVWMHLASSLEPVLGITFHANLHYCITLAISLMLELLGVYFLRIDNPKYKEVYEKANEQQNYFFRKVFVNNLKSAENLLHTGAFLTLTIPIIYYVGSANNPPAVLLIIGTAIVFIAEVVIFGTVNALIWSIVHKRWCNPKKPIDFSKMWNAIINRLRGLS